MSFQKCNCNSIERNLLTKCNFLVLESSLDLDSGSENEGENDEANTEEQKDEEGSKKRRENGEMNSNEVIDGRRAKGKYMLRKIQPSIDRFQPHAMGRKMIEEIVD